MPFKRFRIAAICLGLFPAISWFGGELNSLAGAAHAQSASSTAEDTVQLIRNYYRWINQKKYQGAFSIWEKRGDGNAVNGQSFEKFAGGFGDTAAVSVEIGEPGAVEGAAGSNYIQIPVVISAASTDGSQQEFAGTYTMRSSNMADDKRWNIYSAKVKKVKQQLEL
ncbi:MAG: hypothetical protein K8F90_17050 [Hyphomicrobiales bacterium]|nr:hypothetical protein [Hyphomicrobiales bacterium]